MIKIYYTICIVLVEQSTVIGDCCGQRLHPPALLRDRGEMDEKGTRGITFVPITMSIQMYTQ